MVTASGAVMQTMMMEEEGPAATQQVKVVHMELRARHNVQWTEDTIDNEHMNKRKSKSKSLSPATWPNDVLQF